MSSGALAQTTAGQVVNLLSNDVNRFDYAFIYTHFIWLLPLQVVIICYLIYTKIGVAAVVGVVGIVLQTIPVQCKWFDDYTTFMCTVNDIDSFIKSSNYPNATIVDQYVINDVNKVRY